MTICIMVVMHKSCPLPSDPVYLPVLVGDGKETMIQNTSFPHGYARDDTGDSIAFKNPQYCELTALYWGWKNLDASYIGLVHYRRIFTRKHLGAKWDRILTGAVAEKKMEDLARHQTYVVLPQKRYYILDNLYAHYAHSHHAEDLRVLFDVIQSEFPDYIDAFVTVMKRRSAHMFNMCIMRRDYLDRYCSWLFQVLALVEERLDISQYTDFDKRVFGRLSELLMDVWIEKNEIRYAELPMTNMEGEHWPRKIALFLKRKIAGVRN